MALVIEVYILWPLNDPVIEYQSLLGHHLDVRLFQRLLYLVLMQRLHRLHRVELPSVDLASLEAILRGVFITLSLLLTADVEIIL